MDLLERIPDDQPELKARLKASIDDRIDDLIAATEKSRALREAAVSYGGNWRDIVVFICAILFTIIWWNVSHSRTNWLIMFIAMIILSVVAAIYAGRGIARAIANFMHSNDPTRNRRRLSSGRCPTARGCAPGRRRRRTRTVRCRTRGPGR